MDSTSEARLQNVHPKLAAAIRKMAEMLAGEGITIRVTQGLRSWSQQMGLWLQGRDSHGNVVDPKKIVTKAAPGHSWHQYGLAVDVAPFTTTASGDLPDWNVNHPVWQRIVAVGTSLGLEAGAQWRTFPDWPHFQLTGKWPVSPDDEARQTFLDGGMDQVWKESGLEDA